MQRKKQTVIIIGIIILILVIVLLIIPKILIVRAQNKLKKIPSKIHSNTPPGDGFYSAFSILKIASYSPLFKKDANDMMTHYALKIMGQYKMACYQMKSEASDKALEDVRRKRDDALKKAKTEKEKISIIEKTDYRTDHLNWKSFISIEERKKFCSSWKKFDLWLKKREVNVQCEVCNKKE